MRVIRCTIAWCISFLATTFSQAAEPPSRPILVYQANVAPAETLLARGAIGGFIMLPSVIGEDAARLALRVLAGEKAESMPVTVGDNIKPVFDGPQLQRWNVSEARQPPGSEIRFREASVWAQYRVPILAIAGVVLLQAVLITWLLYEYRQRRRTEDEAHDLSARLINAQEDERARLARELHDDVTQRLALLAIDAGREERRLSNPADGAALRRMPARATM